MQYSLVNELKYKALSFSRLALYTAESLPIILTRKLLNKKSKHNPNLPPDRHRNLINEFKNMIDEDAKNIINKVYSQELLKPESAKEHAKRFALIWYDSILSTLRSNKNKNTEFSAEAQDFFEGLPEYYKRNFHFQTDGYLSRRSAEIYSHQTEILFQGTLALMRRVLIAEVLRDLAHKKKPIKILELGSGSGELTEILLNSGLKIKLTCVDLSQPYMEQAKVRLTKPKNIEFIQGNAESFESHEKYDLIVSSYMFHELPDSARKHVVSNCVQFLKADGIMAIIDSLQWDDSPHFNWALEQFPKDFHEPFYKNYIKSPLTNYFQNYFDNIELKNSFLSKIVVAKGLKK